MSVPFSELQDVAPSAIIELFQLQLNTAQHGTNDIYYFHAGVNLGATGNIFWNAQEYIRFPIEATDFEYNGSGQLPRPKLRVSNIFGTITALLLTLPSGLEGAKVTRIRTLARYIDAVNFPGGVNPTADPTAEFPREIYYVDRKVTENRDLIEFELAAAFDLAGVRAPKRQCISNICQWKYRGPECGYTASVYFDINDNRVGSLAQDVCGKRLRSCELRFAQSRMNGAVTSGSNILTLAQPIPLSSGDTVSGFGVPGGTVVSSATNNLVTLSANATASSAISRSGTLQPNLTQIVVSNASGLAPGMVVTGPYLPDGIQITSISGTTLNITAGVTVPQFLTLVTSKTGTPRQPGTTSIINKNRTVVTDEIYILNIGGAGRAGLQIGQYVASDVLPLSARVQIIGFKSLVRYIIPVLSTSYSVLRTVTTTWGFYSVGAIPGGTYNFTATDQVYTFRADQSIPYGSFPGVGSFTQ